MKEQKVYVAIVTYNRKEYLLNLLEALQQSEKKISGILLLDNKSTDGTNQTLMEIGFTEKDDIGVLHENTWKSMKTYYFEIRKMQEGQVDLQNCLNFRCRFPGIICG
ncbi:MAG: glycosyltransferase [Mediterraneibacter gnavus]